MKKTLIYPLLICLFLSLVPMGALAEPQKTYEPNCASYILMEPVTGKVILEKNADEKLAMASITKLMVLLLTMEKIERGELAKTDIITGTKEAKAVGGSTMFVDEGEKISVDDVLKGVCINSANDGAIALAQHIAGSEAECVKLMNERAKELGMNNTNYINVTGLDAEGHYSSSRDIAILAREFIDNHTEILEYSKIKEEWIRDGKTQLLNTNKLLTQYKYTTGLKTGTETNAKYCVAATAEKDDMKLIAVVLGSPSDKERFDGAKNLLEYGYENYQLVRAAGAGDKEGKIAVNKGKQETVDGKVANDVYIVMPKDANVEIKKDIKLDKQITAPVKEGTKIGTMTLSGEGFDSETVDILTEKNVEKASFFRALLMLFRALFRV